MRDKNLDYSSDYACCYDFITSHKNYGAEVSSLLKFLRSYDSIKSILSVGCGTGTHEFQLAKHGYSVIGVDKSEHMIHQAQSKLIDNLALEFGTSIPWAKGQSDNLFDCSLSLFNVINCCNDLLNLLEFFRSVHSSLKPSSLFFFEAWNGIECLLNPPKIVERTFGNLKENYLVRKATPQLSPHRQELQLTYDINGKISGQRYEFSSIHEITLFTVREITHLLSEAGFKSIKIYTSLPELMPLQKHSHKGHRMLAFSATS